MGKKKSHKSQAQIRREQEEFEREQEYFRRQQEERIKLEQKQEREDPSWSSSGTRRASSRRRRSTASEAVQPSNSSAAPEASSPALANASQSPGPADPETDHSTRPTPDEEVLKQTIGPFALRSGFTLRIPTGREQSQLGSDAGSFNSSTRTGHSVLGQRMRGIGYSPGSNPRLSSSSGTHITQPGIGRGAGKRLPESSTPSPPIAETRRQYFSSAAVTAVLLPSEVAEHPRFAGKRLPGYSPTPIASLRPATTSSVASPARLAVSEVSVPVSSSGHHPSSTSLEVERFHPQSQSKSPQKALESVHEPEEASYEKSTENESDEIFSYSNSPKKQSPEPLTEAEMGSRTPRGPRVPAYPRQSAPYPPEAPAPGVLPETQANRERRARERQTRERQSQEEAREAQAREQQARDQQAREAQAPPLAQHASGLAFPAGGSNINIVASVIDYLAKKGYSRTEAMLRMESANQEIDGRPLPQLGEDSRPKTRQGFDLLKNWVEENLDLYKPELRRVLWPLFVYSFFNMVTSFYPQDAKSFFEANKNMFLPEHTDDIRHFEPISLPEHLQDNSVAKIYRTNKYRVVLSNPAYTNLLQFLESKDKEGGSVMNAILSSFCSVKTLDRAADARFSFASMLNQIGASQTYPAEDEGIPGHHPGSAYTGDNPAMAGTLPRLKLGKLPMEPLLEEDVRAELEEEDEKETQIPGRNTLVQEFDNIIKREDDDEAPSRADIPYPASTARDVHIEVKKVIEHRDRFKIEGRTGGVGPGVSVCMFTFHNTFDSMNCIEISDDCMLIAAGFQQSYIRIWTLDGMNLPVREEFADLGNANSRRLIGHSGAVFAIQFPPCSAIRDNVPDEDRVDTAPRWLLSSSADKSVRLWSLDTYQTMVIYKAHDRPVWDLRFGPFGHYFVTGGSDRTARLWVTDEIRQQRIFVGHDQDVDVVCFHPNSAYIFTGSSDKTVRMWAVSTGNAVRMFTGHSGPITAMECSRDGKILASADDQGVIILWDLAPGRILKRMRGHGKGGIWSLSWSVESTVLVSGGADGTVRIWDVAGPQEGPGRVIGEGGAGAKLDANPSSQNKKKKGKETDVTPDQISAFPTKKSPVYKVKFTNMNLVLAAGCYLPNSS